MREHEWLARTEWDEVPHLPPSALLSGCRRVVVIAAHPDDETLSVGGTVAALAARGVPVVAVVATAGENSHPGSPVWTGAAIAEVRRAEFERALARLAPAATPVHLTHPDGALTAAEDALTRDLTGLLDADDLVLAPWIHDGHPDHDATGRAATAAAAHTGATLHHYPLWLWRWSEPAEVPWDRTLAVELSPADDAARRAALAQYPSQTTPLGPGPVHAPVVDADLLDQADRLVETLFVPPGRPLPAPSTVGTDPAPFDAMYTGDTPDPWGFDDSFYEARKRALLLAVLGRPTYPRVLEIGCATGQLTRSLATRAGHITAMDVSRAALEVAAGTPTPGVEWMLGQTPDDLPAGPFDLIVLSEVGYFLTPGALLATFRRMRRALAPGGEIALVDWRHPTRDIPLTGPLVHRQARSALGGLAHRAHHEDGDVLIDVWGEPVSVAGRGVG